MQALADINIVFGGGWPPAVLDGMEMEELGRWHAIAVERWEARQENA